MHDARELEERLWKALKSDRTVMLGLDGVEDGHSRPMTAQVEGERGPLWFFGASDSALAKNVGDGRRAMAAFSSKDHELFASIAGTLRRDDDRAVIDRLWNPFVAAWYEGKDDPKLALFRLDAEEGEVWVNASSVFAGVKMLLGIDPKKDYQDNTARVDLR